MQKRRLDRVQYSEEQAYTTRKFVMPYIEQIKQISSSTSVLEIGCGECGNMRPFLDLGCNVVGLDINEKQIENARKIFSTHENFSNLELIYSDIYKINSSDIGKFDLIVMRDVIEHIPNQDLFREHIKQFLTNEGNVFFGFPPWQMPFGGHQQGCKSKIASALPYYHLLPNFLYKGMFRLFGESQTTIDSMLNTKSTGISIERFERILNKRAFHIDKKTTYFINPNYEVKFNLKPRKQLGFISKIPYLRNFVSTCVYYIVSPK